MDRPAHNDPHANQPVIRIGAEIVQADAIAIFLHGRGSTARQILSLYDDLALTGFAALAPQAAGNSWYPNSFLAPLESNQPFLDSALCKIDSVVTGLLREGKEPNRVALIGFSQGACLASEYIARHPRRYGAAVLFTGGLIGPPGVLRDYSGTLDGTPVFLGTSNPDTHVPLERVEETKAVFERLGAVVELRAYAGMPHTINDDELAAARALLRSLTADAGSPQR